MKARRRCFSTPAATTTTTSSRPTTTTTATSTATATTTIATNTTQFTCLNIDHFGIYDTFIQPLLCPQ